jgi:hypothetical protein
VRVAVLADSEELLRKALADAVDRAMVRVRAEAALFGDVPDREATAASSAPGLAASLKRIVSSNVVVVGHAIAARASGGRSRPAGQLARGPRRAPPHRATAIGRRGNRRTSNARALLALVTVLAR